MDVLYVVWSPSSSTLERRVFASCRRGDVLLCVLSCVFPVNITQHHPSLPPSFLNSPSQLAQSDNGSDIPPQLLVADRRRLVALVGGERGRDLAEGGLLRHSREPHPLHPPGKSITGGGKVPHHGGLNSCNFMNIISWLVGCCKRIETNAGCRQRGVRGGDRAGSERGGEGARRPTAQRAQGLRCQRTGEARRSR